MSCLSEGTAFNARHLIVELAFNNPSVSLLVPVSLSSGHMTLIADSRRTSRRYLTGACEAQASFDLVILTVAMFRNI
jgi:hypothetical protein